jgi:drug/metabolite transporter (DMT)-like permease
MIESLARRRGIGLAFAAAGVSGVAVFVNAYGVRAVPDATVYTTAKNLVAAVVLLGLAALPLRPVRPVVPLRKVQVLGLGAVAVIGGSIAFVLFFEGLARASSSQAAFVHKTLVVWVAALAVPLLAERFTAWHAAAIGLLVVGQAVLAGGLKGFAFGTGEWLILAATLLWSVEVVLAKRLLRDLPASTVAVARMAGGAVLLVLWVAVTGRWSLLVGLGADGWTWAALTGLVLAGYVALWFSALALAPAVDVTAVLVVAAVVTAGLNIAIKGTAVTGLGVAGMLVIGAGGALAWWAGRTPRRLVST